jgi:2-C-methyl-D-erythritol 2,4-cyclodiphosphate synthase
VDSREYLKLALQDLSTWQVQHIAISIECLMPKITPFIPSMKKNIAQLFSISINDIGITATTGENLSAFGKGEGIQVLCVISVTQA